MEVEFNDSNLERDECPGIDFFYQTLVDTLRSSRLSDPQAKSQAIANSVFYLYTTSGRDCDDVVWQFTTVIVHIYMQIPDDHIWQDILADAVMKVRKRPMHEPKAGAYGGPEYSWEDLFDLYVFVVDFRQRPSFEHHHGEDLRERIIHYQRLTSFAARLLGRGYTRWWMPYPIFELNLVLGKPQEKDVELDCKLFSATEWLLHAADAVYIELCSWQEEWEKGGCKNFGKVLRPEGSALEKWRAWKQQLSEFEGQWERWEFKDSTQERIGQAVKEMKDVEERHWHAGKEEDRKVC